MQHVQRMSRAGLHPDEQFQAENHIVLGAQGSMKKKRPQTTQGRAPSRQRVLSGVERKRGPINNKPARPESSHYLSVHGAAKTFLDKGTEYQKDASQGQTRPVSALLKPVDDPVIFIDETSSINLTNKDSKLN